jgi:hypothetical protein
MGRALHDDSLRSTRGQGEAGERVPEQNRRDSRAQHGRTAYQLRDGIITEFNLRRYPDGSIPHHHR